MDTDAEFVRIKFTEDQLPYIVRDEDEDDERDDDEEWDDDGRFDAWA